MHEITVNGELAQDCAVLPASCCSLCPEYYLHQCPASWTHLEAGAGNYGEEGHTRISQRMTVLMDLTFVSSAPNYVDRLPERDSKPYDASHQFKVLFDTLDQLVERGAL